MTTPPPPGMPRMPEDPGQPSSDDKNMAMISHYGLALIFCCGFAFLPALIIYLVKKDNPWVKGEAAKAFNFVIGPSIVLFFLSVFYNIVGFTTNSLVGSAIACVFWLLAVAVVIGVIVYGVWNGIRTSNGEPTSYPFEIPILK